MLENVRFEPGETSKDEAERAALADKYAAFGDVFVSDGFGVVHRKQASVYELAQRLPSAAGSLVENEVEVLKQLTEDPARPYVVVLGGAKVSDKLAVIANLIKTADTLVIGGGMVFTFLAAQGYGVGKSLLEADQIDAVKGYLNEAAVRRQADRAALRHHRRAGVQGRLAGRPWWRPTPSRTTSWVSTSAPSRPRCSPRSSPAPRRCSGTVRWASPSGRRSRAAPRPSRRH